MSPECPAAESARPPRLPGCETDSPRVISPKPVPGGPDAGIGDGRLSEAAKTRLERPSPANPEPMPALTDVEAVRAWRARCHERWGEDDIADGVPHRRVERGGVRCLEAGDPTRATLIYLHGGGYVLGSARVAIPITNTLAETLHVVSVDYRLAPEHPYPAAVDDVVAVFDILSARGAAVALGGDSAGAGIALRAAIQIQAARRSRDARRGRYRETERGPNALLLLSPHLDHAGPMPHDDPEREDLHAMAAAYRGSIPAHDPRVSPGRSDASGLPSTLVQTGTADQLHGQALAFARRARHAGVDITLDAWVGLWHAWHYHPEVPEAQRALAEAARFVASGSEPDRRRHPA